MMDQKSIDMDLQSIIFFMSLDRSNDMERDVHIIPYRVSSPLCQ